MTLTKKQISVNPCVSVSTMDDSDCFLAVAHHSGLHTESSNLSRTVNCVHNNDALPIELLVYIFTLASAASSSVFDINNLALWNGRLTLTVIVAVCRLWRNAALGAQSLWSTIVLPTGLKHIQQCLETSLYYSKNSPIDIFFFRSPSRRVYDHFQKTCEHDMVFELLSRNDVSSRIRVLNNLPICFLASNNRHTPNDIGSLLRNLSQTIQAVGVLQWEHDDQSHSPLTLSTAVEILQCLPVNLRQLSFQLPSWHNNEISELLRSPSMKSLWGRLSHLNIIGAYCIYFMEATAILHDCVLLEEVQFSWIFGVFFGGDDGYGPMFGRERLNLSHLRQLVIQKYEGDATWLLDSIVCPAIVNLAVKQQAIAHREDLTLNASTRWESFIQRTVSTSTSPKDVLREIWIHGLSKDSIEYILSSDAALSVRSIALAVNSYTLSIPSHAKRWDKKFPLPAPLDLANIYKDVAEDYGLTVQNILQECDTVPWYGWIDSTAPPCLGGFAVQSLDKVASWTDPPTILNLD